MEPSMYDLPEAIDLSHHLSHLAKERLQSPLKGMYKYFGKPGMLMLAGGLPSPAYFPFDSLSGQALTANSFKTSESSFAWLWSVLGGGGSKPKTTAFTIPKFDKDPKAIQLSTALQYGTAIGLPPLAEFIHAFTAKAFTPGYSNFETLLNAGSTDAWSKITTTLLESGDGILCEEWTYPSALSAAWPNGFRPVPLPMDGGGMTPEGMEELLGSWNPDEHDGMRRPRLLYTVPVCQNPTGATMTASRKKAIYAIAVKYDVIIVEDDPYYFLQAGEYERSASSCVKPTSTESDEEFLASLVPSFLKYDYQGRVVRIDTFSKTICPGSRLGWITGNPVFLERMQRANESSTQAGSGFTQAFVAKLLVEEWGMTGWLRWLKGLKAQYRDRRDMLVDCLLEQGHAGLDSRASSSSSTEQVFQWTTKDQRRRDEKGYLAEMSEKGAMTASKGGKTLLSFVAPQGGMFVWLRVHLSNHPSYPHHSTGALIAQLWEQIAEANVLIAPGSMFSATEFGKPLPEPPTSIDAQARQMFGLSSHEKLMSTSEGDGFFRLSFSTASEEEMRTAAKTIGRVVKEFFAKADW